METVKGKNCIYNPGRPCVNCGERTESDGYGEYIHSETGKYACGADSGKAVRRSDSVKVATPR
jgi:hypothetical protein